MESPRHRPEWWLLIVFSDTVHGSQEKMNKLIFSALLLGVTVSGSAAVTTIASYTSPHSGEGHGGAGIGQSVTTPGGGPWDTIEFDFIDSNGAPLATGGLYVLTQEYAGTRANLSSSTAGYLGFTNTIGNGIWDFNGVTLNPQTQYFFYMDSVVGTPAIKLDAAGSYAGGVAYGDGGDRSYASVAGYDALFVLKGSQVSSGTPEPGTLALMAGAAAMLAAFRRRRA
jgi:hypothetical protein